MLPSVRPVISSISSGVSTCLCRIRLRMFGNRPSSVEITVSPNASRSAAVHVRPSLRWYGAYWTKHDITCFPGGAIDGSTSVGMMQSM
jgi:glycogen debranching enzyme